tara:strand:+ start:112 stop:429 length:318 start_codon:yes stop_codon:yes gene_type:complete
MYAMKATRRISPTFGVETINRKIGLPADSPLHPHTDYLQEEEARALERRLEEEEAMELERLRELIRAGSYGSMSGKGQGFKAGGMVRKSRGDGKARRGRTRGRII